MFPIVLLPLLLLGAVSSDRLRFHLEYLIDRNVSACDDFYHHVCSQSVDPNEFFINQVKEIFVNATHRLRPQAMKNSPIAYDLELSQKQQPQVEDSKYEDFARKRCNENITCYIVDQQVYGRLSNKFSVTPRMTSFESNDEPSSIISLIIFDNSAMIEGMIKATVSFFNALQSRAEMIEFMKWNSSFSNFHDICEIAETMKAKMVESIEASNWLHGDEKSDKIREKIKERVANIQVYHDFDEHDKNLTYILKTNRDFNDLYFTNERKTGVAALDLLVGLRYAYDELFAKVENTKEEILVSRIIKNFEFNAFFDAVTTTVTMHAPLMLRDAFTSEILREPFITYHGLGHELYHSLFSKKSPDSHELYGQRGECVMNHFQKSCSKFAKGACASGYHTFNEDTPDVESNRLAYSIFRDLYGSQQTNNEIDGLDTTLEQAFFYYTASSACARDVRSQAWADYDPHSAKNIRINAGLSLMPEFSAAFGCKEGDPMFIKKEESCYVFGPNS